MTVRPYEKAQREAREAAAKKPAPAKKAAPKKEEE